jgi:predicted Zn-dependent protease with MMP-like domain
MTSNDFESAVAQALDELPDDIRRRIANVAIVVEEWPDDETLETADVENPEDLLGFYYGIPLTERTSAYGMVLPDKISLFRQPILLTCSTDEQVRAAIAHTLRHEIAHYFGIDDDRLEELGAY